jgi:hypothetical protein
VKDKVLDKFLFECKQQQNLRPNKGQFGNPLHQQPKKPEPSPYANPDNWYVTGIVELIRQDNLEDIQPLGLFLEERYRLDPATRRLRPLVSNLDSVGTGVPRREEKVCGDHWDTPRQHPIRRDTEQEIIALRQRFFELMGEM